MGYYFKSMLVNTAAICGAILGIWAFVEAFDLPRPPSRATAKDWIKIVSDKLDTEIGRVDKTQQSTATILRDIQLQQNDTRRESVRREKFDKETELTKPDVAPITRSLLKQRIDQLGDDEKKIEREREFLEAERWKKN